MTRVKKAYAFDKMFAVIILISVISLALMALVELAERGACRTGICAKNHESFPFGREDIPYEAL